ncbi:Helicase associated domain protein [Streptomyces sp. NPDC017435]|uniref:Helicase associated domain protein n=1 Tax=Streptomyces sp. NPDC017435 TaxID=3364995 RepID=UPI003791105D
MAHQARTTAANRTPGSGRAGRNPAASGMIVSAIGCGAAGRVAPLQGELTLSFLNRLAARYHLGIRDLLSAVTDVGGQQNLTGMLYPDSEIHLNAQARARVSMLSRVPPQILERALPAWTREEPSGKYGAGPVGRLMRGEEAVAAWGPVCPACTAARTGRRVPARRYLAPEQRVCARHRYWLLHLPATSGLPVALGRCPEVIAAQRRHVRLLHRSPAAAQAFEAARAVTGSWWDHSWPDEERLWPARANASRPADADPGWWKVAARDLITYPEAVALAQLLACRPLQQRTVAESGGHLPYRLGELPQLLTAIADRLGRPWLAHHLAAVTHGPLFAWAHSLVRTRAAPTPAAQKTLWKVHAPHRPRPLSDLLPLPASRADDGPREPQPAKRLRGHSLQAEHAFDRSLAHARVYHQQHGHLAIPKEDAPGDYPLGTWLANLRTRHTRMPALPSRGPLRAVPVVERAMEHAVAAHLASGPRPRRHPRPAPAGPRLSYHQQQPRRMAASGVHPLPRPPSRTTTPPHPDRHRRPGGGRRPAQAAQLRRTLPGRTGACPLLRRRARRAGVRDLRNRP